MLSLKWPKKRKKEIQKFQAIIFMVFWNIVLHDLPVNVLANVLQMKIFQCIP